MRPLFVLAILLVSQLSLIRAQGGVFEKVHALELAGELLPSSVFYFHLPTCGPCKRMEREVLSDSLVIDRLQGFSHVVSVYGLDSLTRVYRKRYAVTTTPCFLFTDEENRVVHRLVGYVSKGEFVKELEGVQAGFGLYSMERRFVAGERDVKFLGRYLESLDKARLIKEKHIQTFMDILTEEERPDSLDFLRLLEFGYYNGEVRVVHGTRLYELIRDNFHDNKWDFDRELLRNRLLFSCYEKVLATEEESRRGLLLEEMERYENGRMNAIASVRKLRYHRFIKESYPSFHFRYERVKAAADREAMEKLIESYEGKPGFSVPEQ